IVVPVQFVPNLIAALEEHWRVFSDSYSNAGWNKGAGPVHGREPSAIKSPAETRHLLDTLEAQHPDADTELHHTNAFELLVPTILSAQSTDARVNLVTPALFRRYPNAHALARATPRALEPQIHSTGFFRAKSRSLIAMAKA